tara:strand:- start:236 stop:652 length:417 start_codon:yes stop_codon:yes gene_type:complete
MSKKGSTDFLQRTVDLKMAVFLALVTFSLVTAFADDINGFVFKSGASYVDKGHYFSQSGDSQCSKVGGTIFSVGGQSKIISNKVIEVLSVSGDATLVSVDGAKRAFEIGHQKYIAGLYVTVFAIGTDDACLIVSNWER